MPSREVTMRVDVKGVPEVVAAFKKAEDMLERLAAERDAAYVVVRKVSRALRTLPSMYTVAEENARRVVSLLHSDVIALADELDALTTDRGDPKVTA